jgi:hypothetical protein
MTAPPSVERIEVTPELARAWIYHSARAPRRHDLHDDKVSRFAKAMAAGEWRADRGAPIEAYGIDGAAHHSVLAAEGVTVGVLGGLIFLIPLDIPACCIVSAVTDCWSAPPGTND